MNLTVTVDTAELVALRTWAEEPAHLYDLAGEGASVAPGDDRRFVREVDVVVVNTASGVIRQRVRVVFSITRMRREERTARFRHATFSLIAGEGTARPGQEDEMLPSPNAVMAILYALGYTGSFRDWICGAHGHDKGVIVVAQELPR